MNIMKFIAISLITTLPFTINADAYQDQKDKAEADFDLEFGGCDAKVAKQQSQIEQLQIHLEDSKNVEEQQKLKISSLQNQLAQQSSGVNAQVANANNQVQSYSNALQEQKAINSRLVVQINQLQTQLANNTAVTHVVKPAQNITRSVTRVLDSTIDIVESWDDALWSWDARKLKNRTGQDFEYICPKNGAVGYLVGVDYYRSNSSVCTAAAHAGIITVKNGGRVIFRIGGKKNSFRGSYRNDVTSKGYKYGGKTHFSFPPQ